MNYLDQLDRPTTHAGTIGSQVNEFLRINLDEASYRKIDTHAKQLADSINSTQRVNFVDPLGAVVFDADKEIEKSYKIVRDIAYYQDFTFSLGKYISLLDCHIEMLNIHGTPSDWGLADGSD